MGSVIRVLLASALLCVGMASSAQAVDCGQPGPDEQPAIGTLTFDEGKIRIDFGTSGEPQRVSATFRVENCTLRDIAELDLDFIAAEGGRDLPPSSLPPEPDLQANGQSLSVQVLLDPDALEAGTYATRWDISGPTIASASFKTIVTKSYTNWPVPASAAVAGLIVGFLFAFAGAYLAVKKSGGSWAWDLRSWFALVVGLGLAVGAVVGVYMTKYVDVQVWEPTLGNWRTLALAAGAAAAGGTVTGQLAKLAGSPAEPETES